MLPGYTTTEVDVASRGTKLYLGPNQNDFADIVAAPYSVRPHSRPTVSTAIDWKELNEKLNPHDFTLKTIPVRLKKKGDLFASVLDIKVGIKNDKILARLF